ncbi:hypothetical protein B5F53_12545 [Blautia sp. An249]|uniref:hypothetical protein n=1 Tax=Blautia sp. An249 TaxID=1965603 RepID=UPI000B368449|nr:hypothetical protein [Blautia sp. An249]OUO77669.1 hypothetical protein B5F53_12545 [Blautia sp. An249]
MNTQHCISEDFHKKYAELYDRLVVVTLKDGNTIKGIFADEFNEDESILISPVGNDIYIIEIADIEKLELSTEN